MVGAGYPAGGGGDGSPVRVTIPSENTAVREVQDRIMAEVARCGFDGQSQFAIKLALEEGLINAIKHGNKYDRPSGCRSNGRARRRNWTCKSRTRGPGSSGADVPDPTLEENIEKCSGRGILLIESYMTSVLWSRGGRRMRMVKRNEPGV